MSSDESPLWALAPIYIIQSSVVKVCALDTCSLGQEFLRNSMQKAKVTSQAEYKKYLSVTRIDKKASEEDEMPPVPNANILSLFFFFHIFANERGFSFTQTIAVLMGLAIYVPLPFLPFATEKSGMQTGRDSTGIKHEGKIKYLPFCFLVLSRTTRRKERDTGCFHSFRHQL